MDYLFNQIDKVDIQYILEKLTKNFWETLAINTELITYATNNVNYLNIRMLDEILNLTSSFPLFILISVVISIIALGTNLISDSLSDLDIYHEATDDIVLTNISRLFYKHSLFLNNVVDNNVIHPIKLLLLNL